MVPAADLRARAAREVDLAASPVKEAAANLVKDHLARAAKAALARVEREAPADPATTVVGHADTEATVPLRAIPPAPLASLAREALASPVRVHLRGAHPAAASPVKEAPASPEKAVLANPVRVHLHGAHPAAAASLARDQASPEKALPPSQAKDQVLPADLLPTDTDTAVTSPNTDTNTAAPTLAIAAHRSLERAAANPARVRAAGPALRRVESLVERAARAQEDGDRRASRASRGGIFVHLRSK